MNIVAAHGGSYPRIGDLREQQRLRQALEAVQRGDISEKDLDRAQQDATREAIGEQVKAGLDVVSDGRIRWYDAVSHPYAKLKGVSITGLLRFYDTNTYFRQPHVTSAISLKSPLIADEVKWAVAVSPKPVLAGLLGPLTLSRLALLKDGYKSPDALMDALTPIIADEVERLVKAGADAIVIEEPHLLREPKALPRLADALEVIAARKGAKRLWLFPSFGDAGALYEKLQGLAVDGLTLDFTYGKAAFDAVASSGSRLGLGLGLVDARNTRLESPAKVASQAEVLLRKVAGPVAGLCATNGLEFLPRTRAYEKLVVLAKARDLLVGKSGRSGKAARPAAKKAAAKRPAARKAARPAARRGKKKGR